MTKRISQIICRCGSTQLAIEGYCKRCAEAYIEQLHEEQRLLQSRIDELEEERRTPRNPAATIPVSMLLVAVNCLVGSTGIKGMTPWRYTEEARMEAATAITDALAHMHVEVPSDGDAS
jgi:hypothetical protein